jgi:hypothetical protein
VKNRYFGDVHDYVKYTLLRQLTDFGGTPTAVCWMLTEDDIGVDGRQTHYLLEPERWRSIDPTVFDFLHDQVLERKRREVKVIEESEVLPNCRFYSEILTDDHAQRQCYFERFFGLARGAEVVFFDPDNGIDVKSIKYGRRGSSKYLYRKEIEMAARADHTLLIYQHLPRQPRRPYIRRVTNRLLKASKRDVVHAIRTGKVSFLLVPRRGSASEFGKTVSEIAQKWDGVLRVSSHRL